MTEHAPFRLRGLVVLGTVLVASACIAALLAPFGWPFELFAHFRWQLAAAALVLLLFALPLRTRWVPLVAVLALASQAVPLAPGPAGAVAMPASPCAGPALRVASLNLWFRNEDAREVLAWLRANPADVVVLQELTPAWAKALEPLREEYPQRLFAPREDPYGIGLMSRGPLDQARTVDLAADGLPSIAAVVVTGGRQVQVVGLHTHWPVLPGLQRARDVTLRNAADLVRSSPVPTVMVGDLNLTPYAPAFPRLLEESGLQDAFASRAWRPTWQAALWPIALPLDHALVPRDACVTEADIGRDVGSDHRPIRVTVRWPASQSR